MPPKKLSDSVSVAYFCMEFALDDDYGIYSGGLGVLAGDMLWQASDSQARLAGVGLAYALTYKQKLAEDGKQVEEDIPIDPAKNGLTKITDDDDNPIEVTVPIQDRQVKIQAWIKKIGQASIILLDANIPDNSTTDQHITNQLYIGDREHRLLQEIVLGIGGVRMLRAMGLEPDIYHMNEGHSAFLSLEVANHYKRHHKDIDFNSALQKCGQKVVFTNHTLVAAGRDVFSFDLVSTYLFEYAKEIEVPIDQIVKMGKIEDTSLFSMNMMALRSACRTNAVSQYHAQKAKEIWTNHPLIPITNGIHVPRWISPHKKFLLENDAPDEKELWLAHQQDKAELIEYVKEQTQETIPQDALIISWARRFVSYKRPLALFWQLYQLKHIIESSPVPIHFLFGGKLHPHNEEGKELMTQIVNLSKSDKFKDNLTFIPNYNLEVARYLVRGSDVWLNTPIEGYEACGTSGMKAALNGVLQCSTNDGWVREVDWNGTGWILDTDHISESLYETIEKKIIPLFTDRKSDYPEEWVKWMIKSSQKVKKDYSAERMINDYYAQLYGAE
ncbi:MAG: alpha-glucan family phosphorylase [Candidatus Pacebacteria bacterium]|nr:alpha-glucan family phosphorylase [Candidatus Paceibacterota bacterium]